MLLEIFYEVVWYLVNVLVVLKLAMSRRVFRHQAPYPLTFMDTGQGHGQSQGHNGFVPQIQIGHEAARIARKVSRLSVIITLHTCGVFGSLGGLQHKLMSDGINGLSTLVAIYVMQCFIPNGLLCLI